MPIISISLLYCYIYSLLIFLYNWELRFRSYCAGTPCLYSVGTALYVQHYTGLQEILCPACSVLAHRGRRVASSCPRQMPALQAPAARRHISGRMASGRHALHIYHAGGRGYRRLPDIPLTGDGISEGAAVSGELALAMQPVEVRFISPSAQAFIYAGLRLCRYPLVQD